jgi:ankyrin repeat protein
LKTDGGPGVDLAAELSCEKAGRLAVTSVDKPPVFQAAFKGDFVSVIELIDGGEDSQSDGRLNYSLLHQAVFWENMDGVVLLTNRGADLNASTLRDDAKFSVKRGSTPLHLAALIGNAKIVRQLLCDGADASIQDHDGNTPAQVAATDACRRAIETAEELQSMTIRMLTAASKGDWDTVRKCIYDGVPPNAAPQNKNFYLLHHAAKEGALDVCVELIRAGALPTLLSKKDAKLPSMCCRHPGVRSVLMELEGPRLCKFHCKRNCAKEIGKDGKVKRVYDTCCRACAMCRGGGDHGPECAA